MVAGAQIRQSGSKFYLFLAGEFQSQPNANTGKNQRHKSAVYLQGITDPVRRANIQ